MIRVCVAGVYSLVDSAARAASVGAIAAGNFAISTALLQRFAAVAASYLPHWEIIDYAHAGKIDGPSGMSRELAWRLAQVRQPEVGMPAENTVGLRDGREDERLRIHYDAGPGAGPYIDGTLLAVRRVAEVTGLVRGLDRIL